MGQGAVDETHPLSAGTLGSLTGPGSLGRYTRELLAAIPVPDPDAPHLAAVERQEATRGGTALVETTRVPALAPDTD